MEIDKNNEIQVKLGEVFIKLGDFIEQYVINEIDNMNKKRFESSP